MTSPKSKTLPHPGPKHLWWPTCHHHHDILMQKHATTMPMIQKEKALWPARTRTIHAAAMPSYSMQISAVFAKLSFKQHQTIVPSFQFWNNNCKSEPYLSEGLIKTYQNMLRGLSASLKCVLDKLRQHSAPNNPRQRKHYVSNTSCDFDKCVVLAWKQSPGKDPYLPVYHKKPARYREQKNASNYERKNMHMKTAKIEHEHPSLANSAHCWSRHPKLHETGWFFCWVILSTWWNVLRKNAAWQLAINIDQMRVFAQCNFYRARKQMKTWYGANKAAKQLQSRCQKLALGQHPSSCSCRNWIKSVLPCLLTSPDGSVFRARCFLPLF